MKLSAIASVVLATSASALPAKRDGASGVTGYTSGNTANDVVNGVCAPLTVIFARGTTEKGNIGKDVGPYLFDAIIKQYGNKVALQGVDYNATWLENVHLGKEGGPQMASLVQKALSQCPSTKITLGGYSQGAMVLHDAMDPSNGIKDNVVQAAVAFGDPFNGVVPGTISSKLFKEYCGPGDNLCHHKQFSENVTTHRDYGMVDGTAAAKFLIDNMNSGGGSNLLGSIIDDLDKK